jgi:hypothetical protein
MSGYQDMWKAMATTHKFELHRDVCRLCGRTAREIVDTENYDCDQKDNEVRQTLAKALKHHGY